MSTEEGEVRVMSETVVPYWPSVLLLLLHCMDIVFSRQKPEPLCSTTVHHLMSVSHVFDLHLIIITLGTLTCTFVCVCVQNLLHVMKML